MILEGEKDDSGRSVRQTADGGYIVVGYTESYAERYANMYLIKLQPDTIPEGQ